MQSGASAEVSYLVWLSGGGCDGCTTAVLSATEPSLEDLLLGHMPDAPSLEIIHPYFFFDSGAGYANWLARAAAGQLASFVLVVEGALYEETASGTFAALTFNEVGESVSAMDWLRALAPQAAAVVALGSCATWGGIPAAAGSCVPVKSVNEVLGNGYRGRSGLPVVNLPGCAPQGAGFVETLTYVFLHMAQLVPLELDAQGRPAWLYQHQAYPLPPRADYAPAIGYGLGERAMVTCAVPTHGWTQNLGGCTRVGGACIGCTEPQFADQFLKWARPDAS
jgi:hydrogenase small subunit